MPLYHTTIGAISLEQHKERYDNITDEEWYILVKGIGHLVVVVNT